MKAGRELDAWIAENVMGEPMPIYEYLQAQLKTEYQVISDNYVNFELHLLGEPGHTDSGQAVADAIARCDTIRKQLNNLEHPPLP